MPTNYTNDIEQVEYFDMLGTKVRQNSCMTGSGAPSSTLKALVGMLYMDTESGEIYKCTSSNDNGTTWAMMGGTSTGGNGSSIKLTCSLVSRVFSILDTDKECIIPYNWSSSDTNDGSSTGDGTVEWTVNGSRVFIKSIPQGDNTFDIRPYLSSGIDNNIILKVTDAYSTVRNLNFTISVNSFGLSWNLKEISVYDASSLLVQVTPTGTGDKTVKLSVDDTVIFEQVVSTSGRNLTITVPVQSHGTHTVKTWFEVNVNGQTVSTEPLVHTGIWLTTGITTRIIAVLTPEVTVGQYGTAAIRYMIIDPNSETSTVILKAGENVVGTLENVGRDIQTWSYKSKDVGTFTLTISCGSVSSNVKLTVTSLGYDISPVTTALVLDLDPSGHSNLEHNKENFGYTDEDGVNHPLVFSDNFDWTHGGFQTDDEGVTAFVVKRGCYVSLDTTLFGINPKSTGMCMKFIFKSENVRNYDASLMTCKYGNVGVQINAQEATFGSELETLKVRYYENRKIEMDFVVHPNTTDSFAYICLKSIPSCPPIRYGSTDTWVQNNPSVLTIGSEDADVWVYRIKEYKAALNRYEILDNFIADCGNPEEMVARYERNDVFDDAGNLNPIKLYKANPDLRVFNFKADRMTTGKSDSVTADVEMYYGAGGEANHLIAKDVSFKAQGTSSLEYILAALNVDVDFSQASSWVNGEGKTLTSYAMRSNSIPVNYFNLKANVASSESANNVILADDYNNMTPYKCAPRLEDAKVRDTVEGNPCTMFFTNTADSAIEVGCRTVQPGETILYFAGDMNNSKKNYTVFGQDNTKYPKQCCVEILNNTENPCRFRSTIVGEKYDGDGNFEFRYPETPTKEMISNFEMMQAWVVSTCRDQANGASFTKPVVYGEETFTTDTVEYREAKFLAEFENYFVKDAMLFHYLFTERHCMTDNRAKNVFMCYEYIPELDDYRWSVRCNYDNDTAEGCDNSGGATFSYGIEDTDIVGSSYAFNANDSTLWCNIRDLMFNDLKDMYVRLRGAGTWNADRIIKKFNDYQDATPEAVRIEDMWNKYFYPWVYKDGSAYALKCHGDKEYWREQFEQYQQIYMDSKYCDVTDRSNAISMRATIDNAAAGNLILTAYSDMYFVVMYGNGGTARVRAKRNVPTLIVCPTDSLGDTETYIFSASHIIAISSLAALKPKFVLATTASRLQQLIIGSGEIGYENLNLNQIGIGNNEMLEILNLQSTPKLETALDMTKLTSLEEFLANGSGLTGVTFAKGAPLKTARVPAVGSLVAIDLTQLETFVIDARNLLTIHVENCPAIDTLDICKNATKLTRGRLTNVIWNDDTPDTILRLASLQIEGGLDSNGDIINGFVLTGRANIKQATQLEINDINAAFPELTVTVTEIVPSYSVTFQNHDGTVLNTQIIRDGGYAKNPVTVGLIGIPKKESDVEHHYEYAGWDTALGPITADCLITATYAPSDRYYCVRYWSDSAETELLQEFFIIAHGSCKFTAKEPDPNDGRLWMGWDAEGTDIISDMNIHALLVEPVLPAVVPADYDYLYSDNPDDNSAYSLAEFAGICINKAHKTYFNVGDKIKIVPHTDVFTDSEIIMKVIGYNHYKLSDGSGEFAGVVFDMVGAMNSNYNMNFSSTNAGGWAVTKLRSYLNDIIFPELPQNWKALIKEVEVLSSIGGGKTDISSSNNKLFLLSVAEINYGNTNNAAPYKNEIDPDAERITFSIYPTANSAIRYKLNGEGVEAEYWWFRSPSIQNSTSFIIFHKDGNIGYEANADNGNSIVFVFCM